MMMMDEDEIKERVWSASGRVAMRLLLCGGWLSMLAMLAGVGDGTDITVARTERSTLGEIWEIWGDFRKWWRVRDMFVCSFGRIGMRMNANECEWMRIRCFSKGTCTSSNQLPPPDDDFTFQALTIEQIFVFPSHTLAFLSGNIPC